MEYGKAVNMRGLHGVLNMPGYALIIHQYSWVPNKQGVLISGGERGWKASGEREGAGVGGLEISIKQKERHYLETRFNFYK